MVFFKRIEICTINVFIYFTLLVLQLPFDKSIIERDRHSNYALSKAERPNYSTNLSYTPNNTLIHKAPTITGRHSAAITRGRNTRPRHLKPTPRESDSHRDSRRHIHAGTQHTLPMRFSSAFCSGSTYGSSTVSSQPVFIQRSRIMFYRAKRTNELYENRSHMQRTEPRVLPG